LIYKPQPKNNEHELQTEHTILISLEVLSWINTYSSRRFCSLSAKRFHSFMHSQNEC